MRREIEVFQSAPELARTAADRIVEIITEALSERRMASIALSGGSTPKGVYELLGSDDYRGRIVWSGVQLFWGDERCVPPHLPESNFRMVKDSLLRQIDIPAGNVHRIMGERSPFDAARLYEEEIKRVFRLQDGSLPEFDLVLLGLGEDGHTASLFPGTEVLQETSRLAAEVHVEKLMSHRITLTFPVINNARNILFLVAGKSKADILHGVLEEPSGQYPAQHVSPLNGRIHWLVDKDAAAALHTEKKT